MRVSPNSGFTYLASPYSHPELAVRVERFMAAQKIVRTAFHDFVSIFSPIVHWHNIAIIHNLPFEYEYWQAQNDPMIGACKMVAVLGIPGWKDSRGVGHEIDLAHELGKPVYLYLPTDHAITGWTTSKLI